MEDDEQIAHEPLESFTEMIMGIVSPKLTYFGFRCFGANLQRKVYYWEDGDVAVYTAMVVYSKGLSSERTLAISMSGIGDDWNMAVINEVEVSASLTHSGGSSRILPKCKIGSESARKKGIFAEHVRALGIGGESCTDKYAMGADAAFLYVDAILLPRLFKRLSRLGYIGREYFPGEYEDFVDELERSEIARDIEEESEAFWEEFGPYLDDD